MRTKNYLKTTLKTISVIIMFFLLTPSVLAGSFQLVINPSTEPIQQGEWKQISGFTKLVPGPLDIFRGLWFHQFTDITVAEKPDWATVSIPESNILTPPDGKKHNFSLYVSVNEDAPAYEYASIKLYVTTGKFIRVVFPNIPILNQEYSMDQAFTIQAEYVPGLRIEPPPLKTFLPHSEGLIPLNITNIGNARSLVEFTIDSDDIPIGWGIKPPASVYIQRDDTYTSQLIVITPDTDDSIDEWVTFPIEISTKSVVDPAGLSMNYTVQITVHCYGK